MPDVIAVMQKHMAPILFTLAAAFLLAGCKTTDNKEKGDLVSIDCKTTPPTRTDFEDDGKTILAQGPVDLGGEPCDKVAASPKLRVGTVKNGKWSMYQNGKMFQTGSYTAGKKTGRWEVLSVNNNLVRVSNYIAGELDGEDLINFDKPEAIWKSKTNYQKGLKNGPYSARTTPEAKCITEGAYKADQKSGKWRECKMHDATKTEYLAFEGSYVEGMRSGPVKYFYPDAKTESQGSILADTECTKKVEERFNEKFKDKEPGKDDRLEKQRQLTACEKLIGAWVFYNPDGSKRAEGGYDDGKKTGTWNEYYRTGAKLGVGKYEKGRRMDWTFFDKGGSKILDADFAGNPLMPKTVQVYAHGRLVSGGGVAMGTVKYTPDKDALEIQEFSKKGEWIEYHSNGKISGKGTYSMNKRSGAWQLFDENGQLIAEGSYNMDKKHGDWREMKDGQFVTTKYFMGKVNTIGK